MPAMMKQNGDERIFFLQKIYFQMQFSLLIYKAMHTPFIQNERFYCNLFEKIGPKYLLVPEPSTSGQEKTAPPGELEFPSRSN